jgi:heat shock protein HslJ
MTARRLTAAAALLLLVVPACGADDEIDPAEGDPADVIDDGIEPPPPELAGTAWEFTVGGGPDGDVVPVDGWPITIEFTDDGVSGTAACNQYGATYRLAGNDLVIEGLYQTEMGCEPDVMAAEAAYLAALSRVDEVTISGGTMVLGSDDTELSFAPQG